MYNSLESREFKIDSMLLELQRFYISFKRCKLSPPKQHAFLFDLGYWSLRGMPLHCNFGRISQSAIKTVGILKLHLFKLIVW